MYNLPCSRGKVTASLSGWVLAIGLLVASLTGCSPTKTSGVSPQVDLAKVFPTLQGWAVSQAVETYDHDHLFNLVDGQADSFFVYGFEQVAVQRYQNAAGVNMNVEIWRLATPADAFGLFTAGRAGSSADIGNEGDADPGLRLAFWQDRYFASVSVDQDVPDDTLLAFGKDISKALPSGGTQPAVMAHLPKADLVDRSSIFFHEEMSVQMEVWLGGENILGLSQATDGVVARYKFGDVTARLMLIEYPAAAQAAAGLKALQSGDVADLLASNQNGTLLGAVFGKVEAAQAQSLLQEAFK
jgi:hypothetical protein